MAGETRVPTRFDRASFSARDRFTSMGGGSIGAKAGGLAAVVGFLEHEIAAAYEPAIQVGIPALAVVATDHFDRFLRQNDLLDVAASPLADESLAAAFRRAVLPADLIADLRAWLDQVHAPLAVRSSSQLEDAVSEPFAGVYLTRMLANNERDQGERTERLASAIRDVYASTFFRKAKAYRRAVRQSGRDEKMAVIIQEVVGTARGGRFYPHLSGVARSCNFYPVGLARPEDGVVELALGLGKIIAEDGVAWPYSPAHPHANPPYSTPRDLVNQTQSTFWAIEIPPPDDAACRRGHAIPVKRYGLADAEADGTLAFIASTYSADDDRIVAGISGKGPRVLDFAPILKAQRIPLNRLLVELLDRCSRALGTSVEIEFAMTLSDPDPLPARFGLLQVRPMLVAYPEVEVRMPDCRSADVLAGSDCALGNGVIDSIRDIVYVRPFAFDPHDGTSIARTLEVINQSLVAADRPYVLIGFGRWGSTDPSAGIPVDFGQISGAQVIVESTLPDVNILLSQGSHFFHNIVSRRALYLSVSHLGQYAVDWGWLEAQVPVTETALVRHVCLRAPLEVRVDGRTRLGVIVKPR